METLNDISIGSGGKSSTGKSSTSKKRENNICSLDVIRTDDFEINIDFDTDETAANSLQVIAPSCANLTNIRVPVAQIN